MREVILSRAPAADILQEKKNQHKKFNVSRENALLRKNKRCTVYFWKVCLQMLFN